MWIILTMRLGWILWMLSFYPHKSVTNACQTSFKTHVGIFPLPEFYPFPVIYQVYSFSLQSSYFSAITFLFEDFKQLSMANGNEWTCSLSNQQWECWVFVITENSLNGIYLGKCVVWKVSKHDSFNHEQCYHSDEFYIPLTQNTIYCKSTLILCIS